MIRETTYTGARKNLAALMDQVTDTHEPVLIRRRGKEPVALIARRRPQLLDGDALPASLSEQCSKVEGSHGSG